MSELCCGAVAYSHMLYVHGGARLSFPPFGLMKAGSDLAALEEPLDGLGARPLHGAGLPELLHHGHHRGRPVQSHLTTHITPHHHPSTTTSDQTRQ